MPSSKPMQPHEIPEVEEYDDETQQLVEELRGNQTPD